MSRVINLDKALGPVPLDNERQVAIPRCITLIVQRDLNFIGLPETKSLVLFCFLVV